MARTIQIISRHIGTIGFKCKGESRNVEFENKGSVGVALVDNDEAEVFLKIGRPDYWKEGAIEIKAETSTSTEATDESTKTKTSPEKVKDLVARISAATTKEEVQALLGSDQRPGVVSAAELRIEELAGKE